VLERRTIMDRHSPISMIAAMAAVALLACSGEDSAPDPPIIPSNAEVYVSGVVFEEVVFLDTWWWLQPWPAVLWKNGAVTRLSKGVQDGLPFNERAYANYIVVDGEDVYVVGEIVKGTNLYCSPVLWKNGEEILLNRHSFDHSSARSIAVADGHVFIAGCETDNSLFPPVSRALLWVDDAPPSLLQAGSGDWSTATSIAVSTSGDVYVAGYTQDGPTLWKNSNPTVFAPNYGDQSPGSVETTNPAQRFGSVWSAAVFVSGNDVYYAAWQRAVETTALGGTQSLSMPVVWKNGEELMRLGANRHSVLDLENWVSFLGDDYYPPTSIFVDGDNVYVTGQVIKRRRGTGEPLLMSHAVLWKNGEETLLSRNAYEASGYPVDGIGNTSTAHCVRVVGDDVYVTGSQLDRDGCAHAVLWVNGKVQDLGLGINSDAFSVFVRDNRTAPSPRQ
jgi:hypothetical protein